MKKIYLLTIAIFFVIAKTDAQAPSFGWGTGAGNAVIGGDDAGYAIKSDAAGNVYVAGTFSGTSDFEPAQNFMMLSTGGGTLQDIFIAKYNSAGTCLWAKSVGSFSATETIHDLDIDASGNLVITGGFKGTADFDPSAATATLTSNAANVYDIYFAKYDASGNFITAKHFGAPTGGGEGQAIRFDASGNICLTGYFGGTVDFDPSAATANIIGSSFDIFMAKYDPLGNYIF
jgi:hypothetical protein